ncbi:hypothetical protein HBF05_01748 [Campylobacter coli]|nr:hypothetical protein [Campylobacter coli]
MRSISSLRAVSRMTGTSSLRARRSRRADRPSTLGIIRSRTTSAGRSRSSRAARPSPSCSTETAKPCWVRYSRRRSRSSTSSSTTRILVPLICLVECLVHAGRCAHDSDCGHHESGALSPYCFSR